MTDNNWWKERHTEHYFKYEDDIQESEELEDKELVKGDDGVYRVVG